MAWTFKNSVAVGGTGVQSAAVDMTGVNLLVACVGYTFGVLTVSDTSSNNWSSVAVTSAHVSSAASTILYVVNPTVSNTMKFTVTAGAPGTVIMGFAGLPAGTPLDQTNSFEITSPTTSIHTSSITPTQNNELLVAGLRFSATTVGLAIDSGFTVANSIGLVSGTNFGAAGAYLIQTTTTAANPLWSWTNSSSSENATIASFFLGTASSSAWVNRHRSFANKR